MKHVRILMIKLYLENELVLLLRCYYWKNKLNKEFNNKRKNISKERYEESHKTLKFLEKFCVFAT